MRGYMMSPVFTLSSLQVEDSKISSPNIWRTLISTEFKFHLNACLVLFNISKLYLCLNLSCLDIARLKHFWDIQDISCFLRHFHGHFQDWRIKNYSGEKNNCSDFDTLKTCLKTHVTTGCQIHKVFYTSYDSFAFWPDIQNVIFLSWPFSRYFPICQETMCLAKITRWNVQGWIW